MAKIPPSIAELFVTGFRAAVPRRFGFTVPVITCQPGDRIVMSWDIALSEIESIPSVP